MKLNSSNAISVSKILYFSSKDVSLLILHFSKSNFIKFKKANKEWIFILDLCILFSKIVFIFSTNLLLKHKIKNFSTSPLFTLLFIKWLKIIVLPVPATPLIILKPSV